MLPCIRRCYRDTDEVAKHVRCARAAAGTRVRRKRRVDQLTGGEPAGDG